MVLVILLVRGATLEGARNGIEYYIGAQSNITKLMEVEVRLSDRIKDQLVWISRQLHELDVSIG